MWRAAILLSLAVIVSTSPTPPLYPTNCTLGTDTSTEFRPRAEHELPSVSEVMLLLQMESMVPSPTETPTLVPHSVKDPVPVEVSSAVPSPTITTLPYTGPGILILPPSSASSAQEPSPTSELNPETGETLQGPQGSSTSTNTHPVHTMHPLVVVGAAIVVIVLVTACFFILMDPRIWSSCCTTRRQQRRLARMQKARQKPLPSWMRVHPIQENANGEKVAPTLSSSPYPVSDSPRSKFSVTSSEYGYCGESDASSLDTVVSSPQVPKLSYDAHDRHSSISPSGGMYRNLTPDLPRKISLGVPVRPPRPPTGDSPARIESKYFADIDDSGFYCYPNPIILEPTSPVINSPPPVVTADVQSQPKLLPPRHQSFASGPLGVDVIQRHIRSHSTPSFDSPSIRNSGSTLETLEPSPGAYSDRTLISTSHRKSTSAVSWIRYSEFQQQHHLRLQQQCAPDDVCTCGPDISPFGDQKEIGAAY